MEEKKQRKKRFSLSSLLLLLVLLAGLSLLLYPTISEQWNRMHQSRAVATYTKEVDKLDDGSKERMLAEAEAYNQTLVHKATAFRDDPEEKEYWDTLNVSSDGMIGFIEIPKINGKFSVYHGTSESILQIAVGHVQGSSLPVGGESTHTVLSGHTGLPSARLFTDIDQLSEGDTFMITILGKKMTYEVDQIHTVLPDEIEDIQIEEGKDLCTLVTCTPYGINTHRLLVRGHRIDNKMQVSVSGDAVKIEPYLVALVLAVGIVLLCLLFYFRRKQSRHRSSENDHQV